jgi:hypothetical protein
VDDMRHSAACDVSFPLRVGLDGHPLYAAFRAVVTKDRAGGQVFATGSVTGHRSGYGTTGGGGER